MIRILREKQSCTSSLHSRPRTLQLVPVKQVRPPPPSGRTLWGAVAGGSYSDLSPSRRQGDSNCKREL